MCSVHPGVVHKKINMEEKRKGEENILSKHNFNLKQLCTKVKHVHLICLFLRKRKPVTHDVDASRALLATLYFNGSAPNVNLNILLLLLPLD